MTTPEGSTLPIAEEFFSIQGEGQWVGTPMYFIRVAGCNVGRPAHAVKAPTPFPVLSNGSEAKACTSWDGRTFPCDTDYERHYTKTVYKIGQDILNSKAYHVCVTGGEPLLRAGAISEMIEMLDSWGIKTHIETSGTICPEKANSGLILPKAWITCSPKINALDKMIRRSDELKLLVDEDFDLYKLTASMYEHPNVFLCPINGVDTVTRANVERCYKLLAEYPGWRMSFQVHKLFGWR